MKRTLRFVFCFLFFFFKIKSPSFGRDPTQNWKIRVNWLVLFFLNAMTIHLLRNHERKKQFQKARQMDRVSTLFHMHKLQRVNRNFSGALNMCVCECDGCNPSSGTYDHKGIHSFCAMVARLNMDFH